MASSSTMSASSHTRSTLDEINASYEADKAFAHLRPWANFVPGVGSLTPKAVFVGEAPGVNEDKQCEPFVGASGRLLNALLHDIGLLRSDCYITNVVKYRPQDNRTPTEEEIAAARPHLRAELKVFENRPPVVLLGRVSLGLLEEQVDVPLAISRLHGVVIVRGEWRFLPVYHPAAALRNGALHRVLQEDFKTLRAMVRSDG